MKVRYRSILIPLTLIVIGVSAAACGGDDEPAANASGAATTSGRAVTSASPSPSVSGAAVFHIADVAQTPRQTVAPGTIVVQQIHGGTTGTDEYVVLSVADDMTVTENWRFQVLTATAGNDPAYEFNRPAASSFSGDFTKLAGTASFRLPRIGSDTHIGYFKPDGTFVDLSGRTGPKEKANQIHPAFGPDDRLYYWQYQSAQPRYLLMSVRVDGSGRRTETAWQKLVPVGQPFHFSQGASPAPVYDSKPETIVRDDGKLAVFIQYGKASVGPLATLSTAPKFAITGGSGLTPVAFLPGSADTFVAVNGDIVTAKVDTVAKTVTVTPVPKLTERKVKGTPTHVSVRPDGSIAYTVVNRITEGPDHTDVSRVVIRDSTGEDCRYASIAQADNQQGSPIIVGHAAS